MRSLGTRRVALAAGAATVAVIALGGCSAGQVAETAMLTAPVAGLSTASPDGSLLIRNLQVVYNSPVGYSAGSNAPLELSLFNQTQQPITVLISSPPPQNAAAGVVSAQQVGLVGTCSLSCPDRPAPSTDTPAPTAGAPSSDPSAAPSASSSASAAPAAPAAQPAKFTIAPLSTETFLPGPADTLQLVGLSGQLAAGGSVNLVFEVSTSTQPLTVLAPFGVPLSPVSRAPGVANENSEE